MRTAQTLDPGRCADMIRRARCTVVMTGAGASTAAGIPDFRGPQGLYVTRRYDPEKVFELDWFVQEPRYFYEFSSDFVGSVKDILPTFTHYFLADLEQRGQLSGVVTQNIDLLHQLAGSRTVIELHGSYRSATCAACRRRYEGLTYAWWENAMHASPVAPVAVCPVCQSVLKPDIVFFGEMVDAFEPARRLVAQCDLLLVLGSSLQVAPASYLPQCTDAVTVVVNQGDVALPAAPQRYFVNGDLDGFFRQVAGYFGQPG